MASATRSGRVLKHEGTSSARSGTAAAKVINEDASISALNTSGTKNRVNSNTAKDIKSATSVSVTSDSYSLRRSSRETPTKNMMTSSSSVKKSETFENQSPSTPPEKKIERREKKRQCSPLRRSERIERNGVSSSSDPKLLNDGSTPPSKKKKLYDVNGTIAVTGTENQIKDKKLDIKFKGAFKKTTTLDARRYRALLQPTKDESSDDDDDDDDEVSLEDDRASKGNSSKLASRGSKKVAEVLDESMEDRFPGKHSVDNCKKSGSRELTESVMTAEKLKFEDKSLASKCSGNSLHLQSSLVGLTAKGNDICFSQREVHCVDTIHDARNLDVEELKASACVASTSELNFLAVDSSMECGVNFKSSKNAKTSADLDSDISINEKNKAFCNPEVLQADVISSLPCGIASKDINRSTMPNKLERGHNLTEANELRLCNAKREHNLVPSVFEDRGTFEFSDGISIPKEHMEVANRKESLVRVQTDRGTNACFLCKQPGQLLCCDGKGCNQNYHLSCLSPSLQHDEPGFWFCYSCVKKRLESGVYSVSEGVESLWDVKEGEKGKYYFVKYKGLAHIHNRWVPENEILLEAPILVAKSDEEHQKEKASRWKQEWTELHRLLQKRQLMPKKLADEYYSGHGNKFAKCNYEWLVKWKGLGYEHATWELESSPFLCSSDARTLICDFESRHDAKKTIDPMTADKALQVKKSPFHKLARLPDDCPAGLDNFHLNSVNQLREFWHKSQNAVIIGDQERIIKSILFISTLKSDICKPILVISTVRFLPLWETEFVRLARSINFVVYTGTKDTRKLIRTLEFYQEGCCAMFQVLLSHPDAIIEDFDAIARVDWEALIIDEYQHPRVSKHFEQLKNISIKFRLLLYNGQLKDNAVEYLNLLSLLESGGKWNGSNSLKYGTPENAGALATLKENLTRYLIMHERKPVSSKFLEYWVPVRLSNMQLEQYCFTLASNSSIFHPYSTDHTGALHDILISTRKCCDHPCLLGESWQSSLTKHFPSEKDLDIRVKASGKLYLLDKFLSEIKKQGLRALILFQNIGWAGRDSVVDILDNFLCQRFGNDSFERIDSRLIMSKKLAALSKFNDKAGGRFVFLLENRACLPSIKLSSVDAVVIFNSDWNPVNDFRALRKIQIESQYECIKVFRLYSAFTVEEKVLICAKQDMILGSNIQNISPSNCNLLLSWGAHHLLNELDGFHQHGNMHEYSENSVDKCFFNDSMSKFLNDVVLELMEQLPEKADNNTCQCLLLVKAQQNGSSYSRNISLVGERDGISSLEKNSSCIWSNLLEKRYPKWRFIPETYQGIQIKFEHFEASEKEPEQENDDTRIKRRKLSNDTVNQIYPQTWHQEKTMGASKEANVPCSISPCSFCQPESISPTTMPTSLSNILNEPETYRSQSNVGSECTPSSDGHLTHNLQTSSISATAVKLLKFPMAEAEGRHYPVTTLYLLLKPEISELCDRLKLPDDVRDLAHMLLEHVMNNHHVDREPETILQAFKLSLCWRAASFLKHKVDHRECLALTRKYLNYTCSEDEADSVYSKLRMLKKIYLQICALKNKDKPNSLENQSSASRKGDVGLHDSSESAASYSEEVGQIKEVSDLQESGHISEVSDLEGLGQINEVSDLQESGYINEVPDLQELGRIKEALDLPESGHFDNLSDLQELGQINEVSDMQGSGQIKEVPDGHRPSDVLVLEQEQALVGQPPSKIQQDLDIWKDVLYRKRVDLIDIICSKRKDALLLKQQVEISDFNIQKEEGKMKLKTEYDVKLALINSVHTDYKTRMNKIELQKKDFSKQMAEIYQHMDCQRRRLATLQKDAKDKEQKIRARWLDEAKAGTLPESFDTLPLTESGFRFKEFKVVLEQVDARHGSRFITSMSSPCRPTLTSENHLEIPSTNNKMSEDAQNPASHSNNIAEVEACDGLKIMSSMSMPCRSALIIGNHLEIPSTNSNERLEDVQTLPSHSSNFTEVEPLRSKGTSYEAFENALLNTVDVEPIEPNETSTEIAISTGTIDNQIVRASDVSVAGVEVQSLAYPSNMAEVVPVRPNAILAEIPNSVSSNMVEVERNVTSDEITASILPAADGDLSKENQTPLSEPEVAPEATDMGPLQANGIEIPEAVPFNIAEVESSEPTETSSEISFSEPELLNARGNQLNKEPLQTNGIEILEAVPSSIAEAEPIEPTITSSEIPFSEPELLNVLGNQPNERPLLTNATEILETVPLNNVQVEHIESNETPIKIPETSFPAADGVISKDSGIPFSEADVLNSVGEQPSVEIATVLPQEIENPALLSNNMVHVESIEPDRLYSAGEGDGSSEIETGTSQMSTADNVLDETVHVESIEPDRLYSAGEGDGSSEIETGTSQINTADNVLDETVHVESIEPDRLYSAGEGDGSSEIEIGTSQMNTADNVLDEILNDSTVATTEAITGFNIREGGDNSDGLHLILSPLQNIEELPSIYHASPNSCFENSVSSEVVSPFSEHENLAACVGTGTTTPAVSVVDVASQIEPIDHHTDSLNSTLLQVPLVDNLSAENGQESTPLPLRSEGEPHIVGTPSILSYSFSMQQTNNDAGIQNEESNQLVAPPPETVGAGGEVHREGICNSSSPSEVRERQSIVTSAVQANQSNISVSQSVVLPALHLPNSSASMGVTQHSGSRLLQILPMAALVHPQELHPDPLQNELTRIRKQVELRTKMHEDKKLQLKAECEQEMERIRKKYDALLQDNEVGFHEDKKILDAINRKVLVNQILAEEFRAKFMAGTSSSQGRSSSSMPPQSHLQTPQAPYAPSPSHLQTPQAPYAPSPSHLQTPQAPYAPSRPSFAPSSFHLPNLRNSMPLVAPPAARALPTVPLPRSVSAQSPSASSVSPPLVVRNTTTTPIHNPNLARSQFSPTLTPRANPQGGGPDPPRAMAPHLHRSRPHTNMMPPSFLPPRFHGPISSPNQPHMATTPVSAAMTPINIPRSCHQPSQFNVSHGVAASLSSAELPYRDVGSVNVASNPASLPASGPEMMTVRPAATVVCLSDDDE